MTALPSIASPSPTRVLPRLLSALPDGLTACGCLIVWIFARAFGPEAVKSLLLMMITEFILVHATGFFTPIALQDQVGPVPRIVGMLAIAMFYLLFVAAFAFAFHAWWPLGVFLWLVVGKVSWVFANPRGSKAELRRQMAAWGFSMVAYIGAVFAGLLLPLPLLGLDPATVASLHLPGSGIWIEHPHTVVAGAVLYYSALAVFKSCSPGASPGTIKSA